MEEKKYIITVGRQYGCGGRELAEILAEKLDVHLYDRQIVHMAAAKLGINDLNEKDLLELENTVKPLVALHSVSFLWHGDGGVESGDVHGRVKCRAQARR